MLRKLSALAGIAILLILTSGCVVQSLHPFYTEENKVDPPEELIGEWKLLAAVFGGDVESENNASEPRKNWVFREDEVLTYSRHNISELLETNYFRIGDKLYCDFTTTDPDENDTKFNELRMINLAPVHTICKVELKDDILELFPLNAEWLDNAIKEKKANLPYSKGDQGALDIFTATSEEWDVFLKEYAKEPGVFYTNKDEGCYFKFQKVTEKKGEVDPAE